MHALRLTIACAFALAAGALPAAEPTAFDAAAAWRGFLAKGTADDVNAAINAIDAVGYDGAGVDADKCKAQAGALAAARARVPVSMALQRAALLCAEANGDRSIAESATQAMASLARHALAEADRGAWPRPVRIVLPGDATALYASAGMSVHYEIFMQLHPAPYFPFLLAAAPVTGGPEKHIQFDYVDTLAQFDRGARAYGTPRLRMGYVDGFVGSAAKAGTVSAVDYQAYMDAAGESSPQAKVAAVRDAAANGGIGSATTWLTVCGLNPAKGCADGLVDALLPGAEARHAYPMLLLALAYAEGIGVTRDPAAAKAMLDAADKAWDRRGASVEYVELWSVLHPGVALPADLATRLREAAAAGNGTAAALALSLRMAREKGFVLSAADEAELARPENNGTGAGFMRLAGWYEDRDKKKSDAYLERAAQADNAEALRRLAYRLREAGGSKPPTAEAMAWFERAANGGDVYAMYYAGYQAYRQGNLQRAEDWMVPAAIRGDVDAMFFLASLWEDNTKGLEGDAARAAKVYESMSASEEYGARARRALSEMAIAGNGMPKDLAKARAWLEQDANAGDLESQVSLGANLLYARLGPADEAAGRRWMERAIEGKSTDAMDQFGLWLHNRGKTDADRLRGAALSRQAAEAGGVSEMNNAAWMLCVSPHAAVRNVADGMQLARKIEAMPDITPGTLDTVAACYAANNEFGHAAELQARVIAEMKRYAQPNEANIKEMTERLALYKAGKPYIESIEETAAD